MNKTAINLGLAERLLLTLIWPLFSIVLVCLLAIIMLVSWPLPLFGTLYKKDNGKYVISFK